MIKWLCLLLYTANAAVSTFFGGQVVVRHYEYKDDKDEDVTYLNNHQRISFKTPPNEDDLPGSDLSGYGYFDNDTFVFTNYTLQPLRSYIQDISQPIRTVTFILNICGQSPNYNKQVFEAQLFKRFAPANAITLEEYYESCSLNQTTFSPVDNTVVGPINVPCTGTTSWGSTYTNTRCGENEIIGWAEYAERNSGLDLTRFKHRIYVIPITMSCAWLGIADVGCFGWCRSWIRSSSSGLSVQALFHELGHNHGLSHATGITGDEYGDFTSAMGGCCSIRCHNAPQASLLKWYKPIAVLTNQTLSPGTARTFSLPPVLTNPINYVQVNNLYLSYRTRTGYDITLAETNKLHIHNFTGATRTRLLAVLSNGMNYRSGNWLIEYTNHTQVKVCHSSRENPDCKECSWCGDGVCDYTRGETCKTCPIDCLGGVVNKTGRVFCCGDLETTDPNFFRCRGRTYNPCNGTFPPPVPSPPLRASPSPSPPSPSPFPPPPVPSPPPQPSAICFCYKPNILPSPFCGNGLCEAYANEDCNSCSIDCPGNCCGKNKTCTAADCQGAVCII